MKEHIEVAREYLHSHYGNRINIGVPIFEEKSKLYRIPLRSNYPFVIKDDEDNSRTEIRVIPMERLGYIYVTQNKRIDQHMTTSRKEAIASIKNYLEIWRNSIENVVTGVTSKNLANLEQFRQFIMPLQRILAYVQEEGTIEESVFGGPKTKKRVKHLRYIRLLEDLELIDRTNGSWQYSEKLLEFQDKTQSLDQLVRRVLAYSLEKRYTALIDVFDLRIIQRTIHLQNSVYLPEIHVERNIGRTPSTIKRIFHSRYNLRIPDFELIADLGSLRAVGSIRRKGERNLYMGKKDLLHRMIERKSDIPPLETLHMGRTRGPDFLSVAQ